MTVDELRARKRELLERKKYELALQAEGKGDNLALFMVNEELLTVNANLRMLTPGHRVGNRHNRQYGDWAPDKQQYRDWIQQDQSLDDEIEDGRALLKQVVDSSREHLTPRQSEMFELWKTTGMGPRAIARHMGLNPSTVSRTLRRAKQTIQKEAERQTENQKRLSACLLDMSDPNVSTVLLSCVTEKQAVCLYLYYGEWLSIRNIEALTGIDKSSILRNINRALVNIGKYLGYREIILDNMDSIGDFAYQLYIAGGPLEDPPEPPTEESPDWGRVKLKLPSTRVKKGITHCPSRCDLPPITVRNSVGDSIMVNSPSMRRQGVHKTHSAFLRMLLERLRKMIESGRNPGRFPIYRWLAEIFQRLKKRKVDAKRTG